MENKLTALALNAIRTSLPLDAWGKFADTIASDRRKRQADLAKTEPDRSWFGALDDLRKKGFVKLPLTLPQATSDAVKSYLAAEQVHKGPHVFSFDGKPRPLDEVRADYSLAGYRSDQILMAPHLLDVFNDPRLVDLIEEYLGCVPTLYSLNGWWSFPANRPELIYSQYFHRDIDDWRFLTLFLYLSDVDESTGPHQLIPGSHTLRGMQDLIYNARAERRNVGNFDAAASFVSSMGEEFSADCERLFGDSIVNATGPTGTMYLVNTMALHRGLMPVQSSRLVVWARYGLGATCNSSDLEHGPFSKRLVPTLMSDNLRNRYINRFFLDFDRGPEY